MIRTSQPMSSAALGRRRIRRRALGGGKGGTWISEQGRKRAVGPQPAILTTKTGPGRGPSSYDAPKARVFVLAELILQRRYMTWTHLYRYVYAQERVNGTTDSAAQRSCAQCAVRRSICVQVHSATRGLSLMRRPQTTLLPPRVRDGPPFEGRKEGRKSGTRTCPQSCCSRCSYSVYHPPKFMKHCPTRGHASRHRVSESLPLTRALSLFLSRVSLVFFLQPMTECNRSMYECSAGRTLVVPLRLSLSLQCFFSCVRILAGRIPIRGCPSAPATTHGRQQHLTNTHPLPTIHPRSPPLPSF
ncbi:hypothetical protein LZ30DRAFT_232493 [Colletotrichum cereale]|nr:hypothetical protein LZ30DRAFT_232493 [Colletotrichum cereale]